MRMIQRSDIKGPVLYGPIRDDFRKHIMELKRPRRIEIGDRVFLVFENRHTLIFQIEEMLRAEGITKEPQIAEEIEVYNQLMPGDQWLSATLFLAVPPGADARTELHRLIGLDEHLILHIGEHAIRAQFEPGRATEDRISAVQYCRFPLDAAAKRALLTEGTPLRLEIDHPEYNHQTACSEELRRSLARDYEA